MTETGPLLDRAGIQEAFRLLGDRLVARGVVADVYVIGGAAMAMAYNIPCLMIISFCPPSRRTEVLIKAPEIGRGRADLPGSWPCRSASNRRARRLNVSIKAGLGRQASPSAAT